jgi:ribonuclease PH
MTRVDGRQPEELRPVSIQTDFMPNAEGSCLIAFGDTRVICTATVEESVPRWMMGRGVGWLTAEYSMLPRSTSDRVPREVNKGRPSGRTQEIQRLIGRSLRAVSDMSAMGERTIWLDCDVLQADGGTRTASITGAYVATSLAFERLVAKGVMKANPLTDSVAAISVGIVDGIPSLDLNYAEDSTAQVDMNVVMTGAGRFVEVQGTAEHGAFERDELDAMLELAAKGITELISTQEGVLASAAP